MLSPAPAPWRCGGELQDPVIVEGDARTRKGARKKGARKWTRKSARRRVRLQPLARGEGLMQGLREILEPRQPDPTGWLRDQKALRARFRVACCLTG